MLLRDLRIVSLTCQSQRPLYNEVKEAVVEPASVAEHEAGTQGILERIARVTLGMQKTDQ